MQSFSDREVSDINRAAQTAQHHIFYHLQAILGNREHLLLCYVLQQNVQCGINK